MEEQNQNLEQEPQVEQEYNPVPHEEVVGAKKNWGLIIGGAALFLVLVAGVLFLFLWESDTEETVEESINLQQEKNKVEQDEPKPEDYETTDYAFVQGTGLASICYLMGDGRQFMEYFPEDDALFEDMPDEMSENDKSMCDSVLFDVDEDGYKFMRYMFTTDEDGDGLNLYLEKKYNSSDKKIDSDNDGVDDLTASQQYGPNYEAFHEQKNIVQEMKEKIEGGEMTNLEEALVICDSMKEDNFYEVYENCVFVAVPLAEDISYCHDAKFYGWTSYRDQCLEYFDYLNMTIDECLKLGSYTARCLDRIDQEEQKKFEACIKFADYSADKYGSTEEVRDEMVQDCFDNLPHFLEFEINGNITFPDGYLLDGSETPDGLNLISSNNISDLGSLGGMYGRIDISTIMRAYSVIYSDIDEVGGELGITVIQYKSAQSLDNEVEKIIGGQPVLPEEDNSSDDPCEGWGCNDFSGSHINLKLKTVSEARENALYLRYNDILVIVWSDSEENMPHARTIADIIMKRIQN